jgi:hypothetical protein
VCHAVSVPSSFSSRRLYADRPPNRPGRKDFS